MSTVHDTSYGGAPSGDDRDIDGGEIDVDLDLEGPDGADGGADDRRARRPGRPATVAEEIRTARFREKLRGYHPDDVDHYLEQLALRVEELEDRLTHASGRLRDAEERAAVASAGEQTVRRTLTLAQRTAELAIAEAQERAARLLEEAEQEAAARVAQVEEEVARTRAREAGRLEAELARLAEAREKASEHLAVLEERRLTEHARLVTIFDELRSVVEERLQP